MEHLIGKPPCYDLICERIGVPQLNAVFTYGKAIYSLRKVEMDPGLEAHEAVHSRQQESLGPEAWWERYTTDRAFRIDQEVPAYRVQYAIYRKHLSRKVHRSLLIRLSKDLAGPLYGRLMTRQAAEDAITS